MEQPCSLCFRWPPFADFADSRSTRGVGALFCAALCAQFVALIGGGVVGRFFTTRVQHTHIDQHSHTHTHKRTYSCTCTRAPTKCAVHLNVVRANAPAQFSRTVCTHATLFCKARAGKRLIIYYMYGCVVRTTRTSKNGWFCIRMHARIDAANRQSHTYLTRAAAVFCEQLHTHSRIRL